MITGLITQKGGAGKTALCIHMGSELLARDLDVALFDADPQGTTLDWHDKGAARGAAIPSTVAVGKGLAQAVPPLAARRQFAFIDTMGRSEERVGSVLGIADVILLPCQPRPGDVWSLKRTIDLVRETQRNERPDLRAAIVVCCARRTRIGADCQRELDDAGLPVMKTVLRLSAHYDEALAAGCGITEKRPTSEFSDELRALCDEFLSTFAKKRARRGR